MGKAKRKVKTKEKKPKDPRNTNKGPMWTVEADKLVRTHRFCQKCGPGVFMAEHYDRLHCGRCGYTMFKRQGGAAAAEAPKEERKKEVRRGKK
jgi:small subunit ribosomal protein S27Ae